MMTFRFLGREPSPKTARVGMEADSRAETVRFLLPQVADNQCAQLMLILPDGTADALLIRDGMAVIPAALTAIPGRIRAWVEILGDGTVAWNSELFYLDVGDLPPISEQIERQYPTAIQDAMYACAQAELYRNQAQAAAALMIARGGLLHFEIEDDGCLYLYYTANAPVVV